MIYLLDTSVIIDCINGKRNRAQLLADLVMVGGHTLACCSISVTEVYVGMKPNEETATEKLIRSLVLLPITFDIARLAGLLKGDYLKKGKTLSVPDATIAAVAIHHQIPLITDNVKDFPMKQLQLHTLPPA
jgi:predicted nucleic acid-binding protein